MWTELVGQSSYYQDLSYTVWNNIDSGLTYDFRLRARNKWGYGSWSDTVSLEASTNPLTQITSATTTNSGANILIQWPSPDTKGSAIVEYEILI